MIVFDTECPLFSFVVPRYFTHREIAVIGMILWLNPKGKGKVRPRTGHEGPEGE
jgi:hypothetical protein